MKGKKVILPKFDSKKILKKSIPLWLAIVIFLNSTALLASVQYYLMSKNFNKYVAELSKTTKNPQDLAKILQQKVIPQSGYALAVKWGDLDQELLESGVIDKQKYDELFKTDPSGKNNMKYLLTSSKDNMSINEKNSHFMVNTLWGLGLVNKSKILDEGLIKTYGDGNHMNYASTGGWSLGTKETSQLYSSKEIIKLDSKQEELVKKIAENVYRPCCGNSTAFPDCNHGMAALGYIEVAVKQGVSEDRIYKDLLALNSYWFPQNYVELATLFNQRGKDWNKVDAKLALSSQYSSAQGAQQVRQSIQTVSGVTTQGGGCGA
ncbi:MAG: hypothetical protein M1450_00705 [Patescibacteria group bacterium]|nr:hypothetical protein [Patescibacteria group bacterium]